ncbi:dihydroorotate dehydrogenase [Robertmurraya yapensis]|uniref:Dihydroorotate dehydrogenase n=2 Tax=Bacillaceae TaxID=186817 RepID=A0A3S0KD29_9BACI|nr:dihydroorotate dehydrogenase [Bacillus yapensis]RTR27884.1 dihydroorotate dehydrogenase [Bacillus yapensis]TKS94287.1 dihydroorotate dehydrogenase [Bacillus yapensis]
MPDWSYHPLFKPIVSRLPGSMGREFIHRGMSFIASVPGGSRFIEFLGHMAPSNHLKRDFLGIPIASPVGLSGKVDPQLTGTCAFSHLGFGFIEIGPVTLEPHLERHASFQNEQIFFPNSLESIGLEKTIRKLQQIQTYDKPLFIRIAKTDSLKELFLLIESLIPFSDGIIIEDALNIEQFEELRAIHGNTRILLSMPVTKAKESRAYIEQLFRCGFIDGIVLEENFMKQGEMKFSPKDQTSEMVLALKELSDIPTIVSGAIYEPNDALLYLEHGADLLFLSSGYVMTGPGLPKRINEALLDHEHTQVEHSGWQWYWLFGFFIFVGGLLALGFSMTSVILSYDEAFLQLTREQIVALNPKIINFMAHDRMTLAGTMISGGLLYMQLARNGVRYGIHWARKAINIAAIIGFFGILFFIGYGYFDWLHGLFWAILLPVFYLGWKKTKNAREVSTSINRTNHPAWKKGTWGQLAFVILGFAFILGGIVISTIGITNVFVSTDILYICMTPEQLNAMTEKLIPVIAHDRAGFGGALISVGLLVLTLSLWGFHQGERWVWYTFLIGGIPAFSAGLLTHFFIGYTTFIHLLPAYIAFGLYIVGLVLSKDFFFETRKI